MLARTASLLLLLATGLFAADVHAKGAAPAHTHDESLTTLGCLSLGRPNAGALLNAVQMPRGEHWEVVSPHTAWGTQETIDYIVTAIAEVRRLYPDSHKVYIGDIAKPNGGRIRPHRSHQSGRDVDISYFYLPGWEAWYRKANVRTLDQARSWAFVRAMLTKTDVELIFIDSRVQRLLYKHALAIGEDREWLDSLFGFRRKSPQPVIRHEPGHASHIHVRFYNPKAQRAAAEAFDALVKQKIITPRFYVRRYRVRPGDTVESVAARAGTSPATLRKVSGLGKKGNLAPGQILDVPMRGQVAEVAAADIPPRPLPPYDPPRFRSSSSSAPAAPQ